MLAQAPHLDPDGIEASPECPGCGEPTRLSLLTPHRYLGKELQTFICTGCDVRVLRTIDEFGRAYA
jgi:hypothetical protein